MEEGPEGAFLAGLTALTQSREGWIFVIGGVLAAALFVYLLGPAQLWDAFRRQNELRRGRGPWWGRRP